MIERGALAARLVVGPGGPFAAEIRRVVDDTGMAGHVHFTGLISPESVSEWLSAADVLCLGVCRNET